MASGQWLVKALKALIRDAHGVRLRQLARMAGQISSSLSSCQAGRGRKKAEGLQFLLPKALVDLPGEHCSDKILPSLHFSPHDGRSTRYDRQDFVALACRAQRTVQVRLRAKRLAPRPDGPLTHFPSPRGEKCRLETVGMMRGCNPSNPSSRLRQSFGAVS